MLVKVLKSKLHRVTVTESKLHYPGSIGIDLDFMEAAGILPYEFVLIADLNNGNRLETYVVPAERGSKKISILGVAARLVKPDDVVIIMNFVYCSPEEAAGIKPKVLVFGEGNEIVKQPA